LAMDRDGSSGGYVRMYVIDRHGRHYIWTLSNADSNRDGEGDGSIDDGGVISSGTVLGNFAPATSPSS
jgi:hypothetical protein